LRGNVYANEKDEVANNLNILIDSVREQIRVESAAFKDAAGKYTQSGMRLYGSDLAFDFGRRTSESESEDLKLKYSDIVLKNTIMQVRPQYDCKFNSDNNLFIVGDEYDKDLDIQAFVLNMSQNNSLFISTYKTPREICTAAAKNINFEFFCDEQGHIQFRPPRYNKVPLSLLLKMLILDVKEGKKLYPPFLISLFNTRRKNIDNELEMVDLGIKIESTLLGNLGITPENMSGIVISSKETGNEQITGLISGNNFSSGLITAAAAQLVTFRSQLRVKNGGPAISINDVEAMISAEKEIASLNDSNNKNMHVARLSHIDKLGQLISRRERLLDIKSKISAQASSFSDIPNNIINNMSPEALSSFADLIEDDMHDFLGPNSSKRFIIYDDQILQYSFTESSENVKCRVDVTGEQDLIGDGPGNIAQVPVLWAGATDFDLWRQYGYGVEGSVSRPYLKDAETQCAPYAVMLLSRQRKNAVRGSVTVYGNEYYQLGDVVYINSRDMLYYVTNISHSFSYEGGTFTTTLSLEYGHSLGEYIPSPIDIVGKGMLKSQRSMNKVVSSRQTTNVFTGRHVANIVFSNKSTDLKDALNGESQYGKFNINELKNALIMLNKHVVSEDPSVYPKIQVRGFSLSSSSVGDVTTRISAIKDWLISPKGLYSSADESYATLSDSYTTKRFRQAHFDKLDGPVLINDDEFIKKNKNYRLLPKEEVFNLIGNDTGMIESIIEIVIVFRG
jgi:hypothetical protein